MVTAFRTALTIPVRTAASVVGDTTIYDEVLDITEAGANSYQGPAQMCVFEFSTPTSLATLGFVQPIVEAKLRSRYLADTRAALAKEGAQVLRVKLERHNTTWTHEYRGTIWAAPATAQAKAGLQALFGIPWGVIIAGALISLVLYVLVRPVINSVTDLVWGPPGKNLSGGPFGLSSTMIVIIVAVIALSSMGRKKEA